MDLLSLVLTLRAGAAAPLPPRLGRAAYAILLDRLAAADPALAARLHGEDGPKPLTSSDLMGARDHGRVTPDLPYTLRYTALTAPVAAALHAAFAPGDTLTFEGVDFTVVAADDGARSDAPDAANHDPHSVWAGQDAYDALAARFLTPGGGSPDRVWALRFAAPTAFKSQGLTLPLPEPALVFGSLVTRWNAFAPVALPADGLRRFAEACVVVSRFSLRSAPGWDRTYGGRRSVRIGAIGKVTYRALNRDRYWLAALGLLAAFARYGGVGIVTTMGMGQVRRMGRDER
jgi:CRISPR-associated endoribonuclease Cas6